MTKNTKNTDSLSSIVEKAVKAAGKSASKAIDKAVDKAVDEAVKIADTPKAKEVKKDKKIARHRKLCYESSNTKVVTVTPDGLIRATGKGTCTIWVYAQNGVYKALKITVK